MSAPFFSILSPRLHELNWSRDHLIFYLLKGSVRLRVNAETYTLTAEDFIAVEPGSLYTLTHGRDVRLLQLTMPDQLLRQLTRAPRGRTIRCFSGDHDQDLSGTLSDVRRRLANLFDLQYSAAVPNELLFTGRAILLYDYLYANFSDFTAEAAPTDSEPNVYDYLRAAYAYAQAHACDGALLTDAAAHIGVTAEYLSRSLRKYMDMSFTDLVHQQRIRVALELLRDSDRSVTDIAYATGYSGPSAFISAFKNALGVTPKYFRTHLMENVPGESLRAQDMELYDSIRKYIRHDGEEDIASGGLASEQRVLAFDADQEGTPFNYGWNRVMAICTASDLLKTTIQAQIRRARKDLDFEYLYFHDVFNDDMMIYEEDSNSQPMYNFRSLDTCLRFVLSEGLKPYVEFSFMPLRLTRPDTGEIRFLNKMNVTPPNDWDKWEGLIRATMEFFVRQFGVERVRTWRFTSAMIYNVFLHNLLSLEDWLELYKRTRRAVKAVCPEAAFLGPGADVTRIAVDWDTAFQPFLDYCRANDCMPDMMSLRLYPIDMRRFTRRTIDSMREDRSLLKRNPNYFVDADYTHRALIEVSKRLKAEGYGPDRVCIDRWNGNVSQTDPSNDICYKSAYIAKTVLENRDLVSSMAYWTLSDVMAHLDFAFVASDLVGSLGLMTADGLRKSAYYGMQLLRMLQGDVLEEGDGYIALRSGRGFVMLFYQYCHYDRDAIEHMLSRQVIADPYTMCVSGDRQVYTIDIRGVSGTVWNAEFFSVGRRTGGNLYENWQRFGYPRVINEWQRSYLDNASMPAYRMAALHVDRGTLHLNCVIEPHDVMVIRLNPGD